MLRYIGFLMTSVNRLLNKRICAILNFLFDNKLTILDVIQRSLTMGKLMCLGICVGFHLSDSLCHARYFLIFYFFIKYATPHINIVFYIEITFYKLREMLYTQYIFSLAFQRVCSVIKVNKRSNGCFLLSIYL